MRVIIFFLLVGANTSMFSQKASTYKQCLAVILSEKGKLASAYKRSESIKQHKTVSSIKYFIYKQLVDSVFPRWYGTEWDYNGYSNIPQKGQIACGYFVSTTLKHVGFNLNRFKLAQQYSSGIVKSLCNNIQYVRNNDTKKLFKYIDSHSNQLYVVGLDNHVGFISKEDDGIYFIHSSYLGPVAVIKERAETAEALIHSNLFVLGHFSNNTTIIHSWLTNEVIEIKK